MSGRRPAPVLRLGPEEEAPNLRRLYAIGEGTAQLADAKLIPIAKIAPNPAQPRRSFDEGTIGELAASVKTRGFLQPIRVRFHEDGYQIIAGERRWRAAKLLGFSEVPAIVVDQTDDNHVFLDSLIENVHREDLNPLDRAAAVRQVRHAFGLTSWEAVAEIVGVRRETVHRLLGIERLPDHIRDDVRAGDLSLQHAKALSHLERLPDLQEEAYREIVDRSLTGPQAEALARELRRSRRQAADIAARDRARAIADGLRLAVQRVLTEIDTNPPDDARRELIAVVAEARRLLDTAHGRLMP
jgi:ParB family chromosome partitioning protein